MSLTFGEKIRTARKLKSLTQKELAEKIGAKHNSVSDWENNKNKPDPDTIELLCGVLNIAPNYLLTTSSDEVSPMDKLFLEKYHNLDTHGRYIVDTILNKEHERCEAIKEKRQEKISHLPDRSYLEPDAAHERTDIPKESRTNELQQMEDDIMDEKNF